MEIMTALKSRLGFIAALAAGVLVLTNFIIKQGGPDIIWQTKKLDVTVAEGGRVSEDISFIVNQDLPSLRIWVSPEIDKYVFARPLLFESLKAGSLVKVQILFIIPENLATGTYEGTIHLRQDWPRRTIAMPLPVILNVIPKPSPSPTPEPSPTATPTPPPVPQILELYYDDGTAEGFDFDPVLGRAVFFTKFVSRGETVKILGAKIFLKIITQPPSPIDVYVWDFNRQPLIPPVRVTPTEEGWFTADLSPYNLIVSDEFYIGIAWSSSTAPPLLGVDLTSPQGKSFVVILSDNVFIPVTNSNFMIRALVEKL